MAMTMRPSEEELFSRAEEAGATLASALRWYLNQSWQLRQQRQTKQHRNNGPMESKNEDDSNKETQNKEEKETHSEIQAAQQRQLRNDPVLCAVVESLWLVGCLLDSEDDASSPTALNSTNDEKTAGNYDGCVDWATIKKVPYQCLVLIIRHFTTPQQWVNDASPADIDHTSSTNPPMKTTSRIENAESSPSEQMCQPLLPIASLQTSLELSLLETANLLPTPPATASKAKTKLMASSDTVETPLMHIHKKLKKNRLTIAI